MKHSFLLNLFVAVISVHAIALEKPEVISAEQWKLQYPAPYRPVLKKAFPPSQHRENGKINFLTFHHAAAIFTDDSESEEIIDIGNKIWIHHAKNSGYEDVAYHYLISQSGRIYKGRPDDIAPASGTSYFSRDVLGNAQYLDDGRLETNILKSKPVPGDNQGHLTLCFLVKDETPSESAQASAIKLAAFLLSKNDLSVEAIRVHREVANSSCPGDVIHTWLRGTLSPEGPKRKSVGADCGVGKIRALLNSVK